METIDSAQRELKLPEIIMYSVKRAENDGELPSGANAQAALVAIAMEASMPGTDVKQIGNTVYISHYNEDKTETSTRAFNVDTARNFVSNTIEYTEGLANDGVKRLTSDFKGEPIRQMFAAVAKSPVAKKFWGMQLFETDEGEYRAYVKLRSTEQ